MDQRLYPRHEKNWDDRLFRDRILSAIGRGRQADVLDLGAGAGIVEQMNLRGIARRVCGVDPDPRVTANPFLDEGRVSYGESVPYADESFDLIFADNVLEHLPDPLAVFREIRRLLRPGGVFLAKTPNTRHYMPFIARLTPHAFHRWVNKRRGRDKADTFPTRYLANSPADIRRLSTAADLEVEQIELIEGRPEYLRFNALTYLAGWLYERLVNSFSSLAPFRILLVIRLRRPETTGR